MWVHAHACYVQLQRLLVCCGKAQPDIHMMIVYRMHGFWIVNIYLNACLSYSVTVALV